VADIIEQNLTIIREVFQNAKPVGWQPSHDDPKPGAPIGGVDAGQWTPGKDGLPENCPVRPLGVSGDICFFVDPIGQVRELKPPMGKTHILTLFSGRAGYLTWAWPRWGERGVNGFAADEVAAALIKACHDLGPWSYVDKTRGRGCWLDDDAQLVLHLGTRIIRNQIISGPSEVHGYVYAARPNIPGPASVKTAQVEEPAQEVLQLLATWRWKRPDVDPMLMLGWIGAAFLSGALPWRPSVYLTGDHGTGKSSLQTLIKGVLSDWLVQAADTTAAGIYQRVKTDCLPVAVDELEGEADFKKQKAVLKLARLAASGALMLRGGDRHEGVEFQARSAFLFSSINTPPLEPQDLSRMAILALRPLDLHTPPPQLIPSRLKAIGQHVLKAMLTQWPRFYSTWAAFRAELGAGGMNARGQDTFGTLLACADLALYDGWNEERLSGLYDGDLKPWSEILAASTVAEFEDKTENWLGCLSHMLSVTPEPWRHTNHVSAGRMLAQYWENTGEYEFSTIKRELGKIGLALVKHGDVPRPNYLAVPNQGPLTRTLFQGSKWAGDVGAGVWAGALRQADEKLFIVERQRVNGVNQRCTLISLAGLYGPDGIFAGQKGRTEEGEA
jgi:hypothetical protein